MADCVIPTFSASAIFSAGIHMPQRTVLYKQFLRQENMYQTSDHLKEMSSGASFPSQRLAAILSHVPVRI